MRVLSWYLPPGRSDEVMTLISQVMPAQGPPLFAGGDLNYNVPAPIPEEDDRAQMVRGFLAEDRPCASTSQAQFIDPRNKVSDIQVNWMLSRFLLRPFGNWEILHAGQTDNPTTLPLLPPFAVVVLQTMKSCQHT